MLLFNNFLRANNNLISTNHQHQEIKKLKNIISKSKTLHEIRIDKCDSYESEVDFSFDDDFNLQ